MAAAGGRLAQGYTTRKLELFSVHLKGLSPLDYAGFFRRMAGAELLQEDIGGDRVVFIVPRPRKDGLAAFVAYEGEEGVRPLIFSKSEVEERVQRLRAGEIVATKTRVVVDPARRRAVIEYNHRGAKANHIAQALERFGRESYGVPNLEFDFAPYISEQFLDAIERFGRIRLATARLVRPNPGWDDQYRGFMGLAEESDARTIEVEVTADRGGSISRTGGLIDALKRLVRENFPSLKTARVEGYREGEDQPTTVSLQNHIEHQRVNVRKGSSGHVDDEEIEAKMVAYLRAGEPR